MPGWMFGLFRNGWDSDARLHAVPGILAAEATADWLRSTPSFPAQEGPPADHWRSAYAKPDADSYAFAGGYRSVSVLPRLPCGVGCGSVVVLGLPSSEHPDRAGPGLRRSWPDLQGGEAACDDGGTGGAGLLLGVVLRNTLQHWHQRWLLYRLVAELCRKQAHLAALGWSLPLYRVDSAAAAAGAREGWVGWYFNALARAAPMVSGVIDPPRLEAIRHALRNGLLLGQVHYHGRNQPRSALAAARLRISCAERAPFASPKALQAIDQGMALAWAKMPPPTMKFLGACSLKRKISPGCRARKLAAEGAQKFTSPMSGRWRSISNQSLSVTAITRLIAINVSVGALWPGRRRSL
jgi:hypothetical protein